jgi:hypothetical protein
MRPSELLRHAALWSRTGARTIRVRNGGVPLGGGSKVVGISEDCPESDQIEVPAVTGGTHALVSDDEAVPAEEAEVVERMAEALGGAGHGLAKMGRRRMMAGRRRS